MNYPTHRLSLEARSFRDSLIVNFVRQGYPQKAIAERLGVSKSIVFRAAKDAGITSKGRRPRLYYDSGEIPT